MDDAERDVKAGDVIAVVMSYARPDETRPATVTFVGRGVYHLNDCVLLGVLDGKTAQLVRTTLHGRRIWTWQYLDPIERLASITAEVRASMAALAVARAGG